MELELASLDPYLASLPEENKVNMKVNMADKLFGQAITNEIQHAKEQINLSQQEVASATVSPQSAQFIFRFIKIYYTIKAIILEKY
ncbi:hypothetical protein [Bacillus sp. AFS096315]|uniref:hypothetical protein n=1 Tax=Bacillus sp. AFS096315 TaxID=2033517 RepID=UPI000BEDF190|nr:hypothetical protein [Bacillus sp. AFS096315]PEC50299.1 hypothetical protein CON00_07045 [Bacillus sp. AFS096315]